MDKNQLIQNEFLFYTGNDGTTKIQVLVEDETIWVTLINICHSMVVIVLMQWQKTTDPNAWTVKNNKLYLNYNKSVRRTWSLSANNNIRSADRNWKTKFSN